MMEYSAANLNTACESILEKLEVLQTSAIRMALGLPKCVPNIVLRKCAGIPTLYNIIHSPGF